MSVLDSLPCYTNQPAADSECDSVAQQVSRLPRPPAVWFPSECLGPAQHHGFSGGVTSWEAGLQGPAAPSVCVAGPIVGAQTGQLPEAT